MLNRRVLALVFATLATLIISAPHAAVANDTGERIIRNAGYDFSYFGKDLGDERFTITETEDGYRIEATLDLRIDGQVPSHAVYEVDKDRRLVRATYRELIRNGAHAEYRVENGELIAVGLGGSAHGERRIRLEEDAVVTGPHYVTDFFVLEPLALDVGKRHEQVAYAFGFSGWEPSRVTLKSRRDRDKRMRDAGGDRVGTTVYRCEIVTNEKTFKTTSCLDADGVSLKIKVGAPIGSMNVTIE